MISWRYCLALLICSAALLALPKQSVAEIDQDRFEKEVLVPACSDPMQIEVLSDGSVLFIERMGTLKHWHPVDQTVTTIGEVPVELYCEVGLMGFAIAPDFDRSGHLYFFYCPRGLRDTMRLSRFTLLQGKLSLESEEKYFEYSMDLAGCHHQGGGLAFGPDGCLYIGTGDNSYPIPELPVDQRPGQEHCDALRTSANSNDLRGKILRIRPKSAGGYEIPAGNLFTDRKQGRPEIYCMGIRNAFRISVDSQTGWVYWGDVGPNVKPELKIGPEGYDEFNQARKAGNFGWPMFTGPNDAYRSYDFDKREPGALFDVIAPFNYSRNNTGIKELPPAMSALVWYPTAETTAFPGLGSGGRAAMAGPVYRNRPQYDPLLKLPDEYDGALIVFDWMRYWVKLIRFDRNGDFASIEPFAANLSFRRPIEMKIGPDGRLCVVEFGDKWGGNTDSRIVRVGYRRGNRAPVASFTSNPLAGRHPLQVTFDGTSSFDKDHDPLTYEWRVGTEPMPRASGPVARLTFDKPGSYKVRLTVCDSHHAEGSAESMLHVGNSPPVVKLISPRDGSFFDWDEPIPYRVIVDDNEEGSTENGRIAPGRVTVRTELQVRAKDSAEIDPGLALMRKSNCFGCHSTTATSAGPAYAVVAAKYKKDPEARERLVKKVLSGGAGVWGPHPMPPQSQLTIEQARSAVDWVLNSAEKSPATMVSGTAGILLASPKLKDDLLRRMVVSASLTDNGADGVPALTGDDSITLLMRQQRAAFADSITEGKIFDELEAGERLIVRLEAAGSLNFGRIDLTGIESIALRASSLHGADVEVRTKNATGEILGQVTIPAGKEFREHTVAIGSPQREAEELMILARNPVSISWIEFRESTTENAARMARTEAARERMIALEQLNGPKVFVHKWSTDEIAPLLPQSRSGRSWERGWSTFRQANCLTCHRLGGFGGTLGPDLDDVSRRLANQPDPRLALLREMTEPSLVVADAYKPVNVVTRDGLQYQGILANQTETVVRLRQFPPAPQEMKEIPRSEIDEIATLKISPMPEGVLNVLTLDEILDLIALLESRGDPRNPAYQK